MSSHYLGYVVGFITKVFFLFLVVAKFALLSPESSANAKSPVTASWCGLHGANVLILRDT
jgi:hypothetical protein